MGPRIRILVAEDLPDIRRKLCVVLRERQFEVLEAIDGSEALELIEHPDGFDLVITDINMPGFNGFEVAEHARARHPTIPILFVTGRPEQLDAYGIGEPVRCVPKPIRIALLLEAVTELLQAVVEDAPCP